MNATIWKVFEIAVNIYEGFNIFYFVFSFFEYNFKPKENRLVFSIGVLGYTIVVSIINQLTFYEGIIGVIYIFLVFIFALFVLYGSIIKKLFVSATAFLCILAVNSLVATFISSIANTELVNIYTQKSIERLMMILAVQLIVTYIYRLILKAFKKNGTLLNIREWILISTVLVLSFIMFLIIHQIQLNSEISIYSNNNLLLVSFGLVVINVVCYYMTVNLSKANSIRTENKLLRLEQEYRQHYTENAQKQYEEIKRIRHDIKQSCSVMEQLISEKRFIELQHYLQQFNNEISIGESTVNTNNHIVNAIINTKLGEAKRKGIKTFCNTIRNINTNDIADIDICNLLGNMLDNAIEATEMCGETETKYIEINISINGEMLIISVKNSYNPKNSSIDLQTNKHNKEHHGFGTKSIKKIASKYNGEADFYNENGMFCCNVYLQISM